jgi:hypothetical protein
MKAEKTRNALTGLVNYIDNLDTDCTCEDCTEQRLISDELSEIEDKADKWDEKEAPFVPTEQKFIRNYDENLVGKCKCGNTVYEHTKYCCDCGQKLKFDKGV